MCNGTKHSMEYNSTVSDCTVVAGSERPEVNRAVSGEHQSASIDRRIELRNRVLQFESSPDGMLLNPIITVVQSLSSVIVHALSLL